MKRLPHGALAVLIVALSSFAAFGFSATPQQRRRPHPAPAAPAGPPDPTLAGLTDALPTLDDKMRRGLALQVALDRAGFSPGEIDGAPGVNTDRAMAAFKGAKGTLEFGDSYAKPVMSYTITAEDAAGPFVDRIPEDMMEKSTLKSLAYTSVLESLGERFHASPKLLQRLNPASQFVQGDAITVPNVEPFVPPAVKGAAQPAGTGLTVTVTDRTKTLQVENAAGEVVMYAPVTVGSENDPLPVGEWKVNGVSRNPTFNYNPKLFWDAEPSHGKAKIPAGPNNPVGVVWIDLSKEHYGIHGTPEPSRIGYTESHGCIRLTNWDAARLADLVGPGTKVVLR